MFLLLLLRQELTICINNFVTTLHSTRTRHGRCLNIPHPLINCTVSCGSSGFEDMTMTSIFASPTMQCVMTRTRCRKQSAIKRYLKPGISNTAFTRSTIYYPWWWQIINRNALLITVPTLKKTGKQEANKPNLCAKHYPINLSNPFHYP